jgi:hypothetical protein
MVKGGPPLEAVLARGPLLFVDFGGLEIRSDPTNLVQVGAYSREVREVDDHVRLF